MLPYVLTSIGMFLRKWYVNVKSSKDGGVTLFTVIGVILTVIGVLMTISRQGGKYADKKRLGIALGIHGAIWLAGLLFFGAVSWILNKIVYLIAAIIGLVIAYFWFSSLNEGGSPKEVRQDGDGKKGIDALPNLMYSDGNVRWTLERREADFAIYRNDNGGTITIRNADVSGGQILSDAGHFQTYR